jgi:hypothetical protein
MYVNGVHVQGSGIRENKEKLDAKLAQEKEKLADINKMVDGMSTEYRKLFVDLRMCPCMSNDRCGKTQRFCVSGFL